MSIESIAKAFGTDDQFHGARVDRDNVESWMTSEDLEELGLLFRYLTTIRYAELVEPRMPPEALYEFSRKYLERCLLADPNGFHTHNRYEAGWEIASIFFRLWEQGSLLRLECDKFKFWMESILRAADAETRLCLVNATLEHLFERSEIATYFKSWSRDDFLSSVYSEALQWRKHGGRSPLGS